MKLLTTNLTAEQAKIIMFLQLFAPMVKFLDASKIEVHQGYEDSQAFNVDWIHFYKDECEIDATEYWIAGTIESSGGSYWEPPDIDFVEILAQDEKQSICNFVIELLKRILEDQFEMALTAEGEREYEHQCSKSGSIWDDYPIPF